MFATPSARDIADIRIVTFLEIEFNYNYGRNK